MVSASKKHLFEDAPVISAILKLAIPSVIGQLILVIYNLADTFFVSKAAAELTSIGMTDLGLALTSGVANCMPIYMILTAISNLFGIGAASVMSRSAGKKKYDRAKNASRFAIWGCFITSIIYCLLVFLFRDSIVNFMASEKGTSETVREIAKTYISITVCAFGVPTAMNTLFSHLMRAEGKSFHASFGIGLGGVLNVVLDAIFIMLIFDYQNAAIAVGLATGISNCIALIYYLILFIKRKEETNISFVPSKEMVQNSIPSEILTIGLPACLMTLCENISYLILDRLISSLNVLNNAAYEGVAVAKKVNMVAHSIARGMTQGVLPLIGYNKSSGRRIRMKKIVFTSTAITTSIALVCMTLNIILREPLCSIFSSQSDPIKYGSLYLWIFSIGAPFSAFAYSVISFFQAVGKAWRSLLLALLRKGILDIPLMFILPFIISSSPGKEGVSIIWATPIADIICALTAAVLFIYYLKRHGSKDKNIESEKTI